MNKGAKYALGQYQLICLNPFYHHKKALFHEIEAPFVMIATTKTSPPREQVTQNIQNRLTVLRKFFFFRIRRYLVEDIIDCFT